METKSKNIMMITALVSLIIIGLVMLNGCEKSEPTTSSTTEVTTNEMAEISTIWTCSMHPEIQQSEPGSCEKCGMNLIPLEQDEISEESSYEMMKPDITANDITLQVAAANGQTLCPIMESPIDTDVFVEYQGKKVYFCCSDCETKFLENPEEYVAKLPQFTE